MAKYSLYLGPVEWDELLKYIFVSIGLLQDLKAQPYWGSLGLMGYHPGPYFLAVVIQRDDK